MMYVIVAVVFIVLVAVGVGIFKYTAKPPRTLDGEHVMITGGSSGIGESVAREVLKRGAKVTIVARNKKKLATTEKELNKLYFEQFWQQQEKVVQTFSVDIGGSRKELSELVENAERTFGPVYMLVNCAGFAKAARFEDLSESTVRDMMSVNFFGSFFLSQEVVRSMKQYEDGGVIVFVSSISGLFGLYGFTAYSAAKGALVKMAEALHMELKPFDIDVSVHFPPDTDTPGLVEENKSKPLETKLICEVGGLIQPDIVARRLVTDALKGKFLSTIGFEGFMTATMCGGMCPITDALTFVSQVCLSGLFRAISALYLYKFAKVVRKEYVTRSQSKKIE